MKVLSVRQPWAGLIFFGKDCENRTWYTAYRGHLLIHASMRADRGAFEYFETPEGKALMERESLPAACEVYGAVLGRVEVVDCLAFNFTDSKTRSDWHMQGQYGIYLRDATLFDDPIPCKGKLKIFNAPPHVNQAVEELLCEGCGSGFAEGYSADEVHLCAKCLEANAV